MYEVGEIFEGTYPSDAAAWCNSTGQYYIVELEEESDVRRFQIQEIPKPTPPVLTTAEKAATIRAERDRRLTVTDYLMLPDYSLLEEERTVVVEYRQALRDLPQQEGFPWNGVEDAPWPPFPTAFTRTINL